MNRDRSVDYFKALLVIGMVYTHILQFFGDYDRFPSIEYSTQFFNLITFSGFVFCFGYVNQLAYYRKSFSSVWKKMLITGLKTLIAFYISGLAFQVFIGNEPLSLETMMPIIFLQVIPGWSEFLVSFSLIILLGLAAFKLFTYLTERPALFWSISLLILATTWIDYSQVSSPIMGLLIGTNDFPTFPVLQYLGFYLIGIYFAKYQIGWRIKYLLVSGLGTALFIYYLVSNDFQLPGRFPPSIYWIVGPSLFLYLYFIFSKFLDKWGKGFGYLLLMGENVLFFLLLSNIIIFSLESKLTFWIIGPWEALLFTIVLLLVITYFTKIIARQHHKLNQ